MAPDGSSGVGVTVTLREIYDATLMTARTADGARSDIDSLRQEIKRLSGRVGAVEKQLQTGAPAYLKRAGYALGLLVAGAASGWAAVRGG